jgi:hypothetical protein
MCARIRQARFCDITQLSARFSKRAFYGVVMPFSENTENSIKAIKTKITRNLRKSTDGIYCSVETSINDALHLNLILTSDNQITPAPFQKVIKSLNLEADIFLDEIDKADICKVTAYASKRKSIPSNERYKGNTVNFSGNMRTMSQIMQSQRMMKHSPLIALTALNLRLQKLGFAPISQAIHKTNTMQTALDDFIDMANQFDFQKICYSKTYGILTESDFADLYSKTVGMARMEF